MCIRTVTLFKIYFPLIVDICYNISFMCRTGTLSVSLKSLMLRLQTVSEGCWKSCLLSFRVLSWTLGEGGSSWNAGDTSGSTKGVLNLSPTAAPRLPTPHLKPYFYKA